MREELYINGFQVDLMEGMPIPLTFQITDITEPDKKRGNRSKTIHLPGTANNMTIFNTCFDVRLTDGFTGVVNFDPSKKQPVRYYSKGLIQFEGVCSIKQCTVKNKVWTFEILMFSDFMNYMDELKKIRLSELGWDDYLHDLDKDEIEETWGGTIRVNGTPTSNAVLGNWSGIGYYYGLIDYGSRLVDDEWQLVDMIPQVFVYDIIKRMFDQIGVEVDSDFFDSQRFRRLLLAWEGGELPFVDATDSDNSSIYTEQAVSNLTTLTFQQLNASAFVSSPYSLGTVVQDINSQIQTNVPFLATILEDGLYNISYSARYNVTFNPFSGNPFGGDPMRIRFYLNTVIDGVTVETPLIYDQQTSILTGTSPITFPITLTHALTREIDSQSQIRFFVVSNITYVPQPGLFLPLVESAVVDVLSSSQLNIVRDPMAHIAGQDVKIKYFMPKMTCDVFFKGIMNMFNLYLEVDPVNAKQIYIEPLIDYYKGTNKALDMTSRLDYSEEIEVIPTPSIAAKSYNWKFKDSKDLSNEIYLNTTLNQYGARELPSNVDFATSDVNYVLPFSCIPVSEIDTLILPRVVQRRGNEDVRYKSAPFIVQLGNAPTTTNQRDGDWKLIHTTGTATYTKQPYVGHINLPDNPTASTAFDLTFKVPQYVFYQATGYTTRNLYIYHERFIKEIVDRFGKMLKGRFRLNAKDIQELDLGVLWQVDGVMYRVQKISDYDAQYDRTTKVELIKLIEGESIISRGVPVAPINVKITF
jgi:hypothetical protein